MDSKISTEPLEAKRVAEVPAKSKRPKIYTFKIQTKITPEIGRIVRRVANKFAAKEAWVIRNAIELVFARGEGPAFDALVQWGRQRPDQDEPTSTTKGVRQPQAPSAKAERKRSKPS